MNKRMQYLVEGITKDIIAYLMEDSGCDLPTALKEFYNSETLQNSLMNLRVSILKVQLMYMKC